MLTNEQMKVLSSILADVGQVCIASIVVPFVFPSFDIAAITTIISGLGFALYFWILSLLIVRTVK